MKYWFFLLVSALTAAPITAYIARRPRKDQCAALDPTGGRCPGRTSRVCVDNLCPDHCKKLHGDGCVVRLYGKTE